MKAFAIAALLVACGSENAPSVEVAGASSASAGSTSAGSTSAGSAGLSPGGASAGSAGLTAGSAGSPEIGGSEGAGENAGSGGNSAGSSAQAGAAPTGPTLAFPSAQGFGKSATGGRNGTVVHVTNLNDSGAGSFRDAVSAPNRIVVFDVGGYIQLKTAVSVKSNLTIAGQSAPGGGIGFRGGELSFANASNIVVRHVRIRPGSETASDTDDALSLYRAQNVMLDHCSFEFAPWNDIDGVSDDWQAHPVTNISIQDSLIADPTGQQFGAHCESVASNWAFYRNIFANSHNRNPLAKVNDVFVNNVLYNDSAGYTTHTSTSFQHDIVNNYFIFGPASSGTDNTWYQVDKNQAIFYAGNLKDTNRNGVLDGAATTPYWYQGTGTILSKAWSSETSAEPALDPASAVRVAASLAGALPRDPLDALIVSQVLTLGKGTTGLGANTVGPDGALYTSQAQTGLPNQGYGTILGGTKPADADNDGMPDAWEKAVGSDPAKADGTSKSADGYTLIEGYLNWLAEPHASSSAGAAVAIDLSAYATGFGAVSPVYAVKDAQGGTVSVEVSSARFQPSSGFRGLAHFTFTISGTDGTAYSKQLTVLSAP